MLYQIIAFTELFIKHGPLRVFFLPLSRVCGDGSALLCLRLAINTDGADVQNTQRYWTFTTLPSVSDCGIFTPKLSSSSTKATAEHYTTSIPPITVYPNRKINTLTDKKAAVTSS